MWDFILHLLQFDFLNPLRVWLGIPIIIPHVDYPKSGLWILMLGLVFWVPVYVIVVRNVFKKQYVEMPVFAGCMAIAWEALWGIFFRSGYPLASAFYLLGFLLDTVIFYGILKYGHKQVSIPSIPQIKNHYKPICWVLMLLWLPMWLFFGIQFDRAWPLGLTSGSLATLIMSACYVITIIKQPPENAQNYSLIAGWCKMIGTGLATVSLFILCPENHFAQMCGIIIFPLDLIYIRVLTGKKDLATSSP